MRITRGALTLPFLEVEVADIDFGHVRRLRRVLFGGPCLIQCRHWGRALDSGHQGAPGTLPVLYDTHAMPWQQWLIQRADKDGSVRIVSVHCGLALAEGDGRGDRSPVVLRTSRKSDRAQRWHLDPTDDGAAFVIVNAGSGKALDAGERPDNHSAPGTWEPHWHIWQQWVISRLPVARPASK